MSKLLGALAGAGYALRSGMRTYKALEDMERDRSREKREQDRADREAEQHTTEQGLRRAKAEDYHQERAERQAAEDAARRAAEESQSAPSAVPGGAAMEVPGPRTLDLVKDKRGTYGMPEGGEPAVSGPEDTPKDWGPGTVARMPLSAARPEAPEQAAPQQPPKQTWMRVAEAQRDFWMKRGKPDRAAKVMTDSINNEIATKEAHYKYKVMPRVEKIRDSGLTIQDLQNDKTFRDLRQESVNHSSAVAGLMWGHVLSGNTRAAVDAFNASGIVMPGTKAAQVGRSDDGQAIALLDADGKIVRDKEGRDLVFPKQLLDRLWTQSHTTTEKLTKGQSIVQTTRQPGGGVSVAPVYTAPDPEAARRATKDDRAQDNKDRDVADRRAREARHAVERALFAGQTMMDRVSEQKQKLHGIAAPLAERYVREQKMDPGAAAAKAIKDAEAQARREAAGAGPRGTDAAPGGNTPTWRDVLK